MILAIGEILYDVFPNYKRLGGAPFNVAFHLKNMNTPVHFISRVGDDGEGRQIIDYLKENQFDVDGIQIDKNHETGKVMVELDDQGSPTFDIKTRAAYDYIDYNQIMASIPQLPIELIYFGTLAQRTQRGFETMRKFLSTASPETKILYDINLRPRCYNQPIIENSLQACNLLKLSREEVRVLEKMIDYKDSGLAFIDYLRDQYRVEMIALTKGADGSELFMGDQHWQKGPLSPQTVVDTVGAGDAYTAVLAIGYVNKWPPKLILEKAAEFAAAICTIEGAIPPTTDFYRNILEPLKGGDDEK